jgi:nitrogenase molybdenum-iron protein alpha/beta subunit
MDLISDSHAWLHGKKFALYGDPDFVLGMVKILLEVGAEPTSCPTTPTSAGPRRSRSCSPPAPLASMARCMRQ